MTSQSPQLCPKDWKLVIISSRQKYDLKPSGANAGCENSMTPIVVFL